MRWGLLLTIIIGCAILVAYSIIEIRVNQRVCPACGFRTSRDAPDEQCAGCGEAIK